MVNKIVTHSRLQSSFTQLWAKIKASFAPASWGVEYIKSTQTGTTNVWTGVTKDTALYEGKQIMFHLLHSPTSIQATLNLTFPNGTQSGPVPVWLKATGALTGHFPENSLMSLTYIKGADGVFRWQLDAFYDTNSTDAVSFNRSLKARDSIHANAIIASDATGYKKVSPGDVIDLKFPVLLSGWEATPANGSMSPFLAYSIVYNYNQHGTPTYAPQKPFYLVLEKHVPAGVANWDTLTFKVAPEVFTATPPTQEDGKYYLHIGYGRTPASLNFVSSRDFYAYRAGSFRKVDPYTDEQLSGIDTLLETIING